MRIVAGAAKGRKLVVPDGRDVRPTSDRVREAVFSSLGAHVVGATVLDLFAGSGALGLESLSRGAESAVFVERSRRAMEALESNLDLVGFRRRARVLKGDAFSVLGRLHAEETGFDLVFLDPPYGTGDLGRALGELEEKGILHPGGRIVAEHPRDEKLPDTGLKIRSVKSYGGTAVTTLERTKDS